RGKSRLSEPPSRSGTAPGKCLNEDLAGRALAEKCRGAGAGAVGPRAEDRDEVADLGTGQQRLVGEPVERRAQAADDIRLFDRLRTVPAGDRRRVIAPHDSAEVARSGELVVQAAVGDQEDL